MPLSLSHCDDIISSSGLSFTPPPLSPKFFSSRLTGNSTTTSGLLSSSFHPAASSSGAVRFHEDIHTESSDTMTVRYRPVSLLHSSVYDFYVRSAQGSYPFPDVKYAYELTEVVSHPDVRVFYFPAPHTLTIVEPKKFDKRPKNPNSLHALYRCALFIVPTDADKGVPQPGTASTFDPVDFSSHGTPYVVSTLSTHPCGGQVFDELFSLIDDSVALPLSADDVDFSSMKAFFRSEYNLTEILTSMAYQWNRTDVDSSFASVMKEFLSVVTPHVRDSSSEFHEDALRAIKAQLRYMESYTIPLDVYVAIRHQLYELLSSQDAATLCTLNLNLLLSDMLAALGEEKKRHVQIPPPDASRLSVVPTKLSDQQRTAVTTDENCALIVAAAGTGKTTTIINRIEYLTYQPSGGSAIFEPSEIMSLSFTNAAADNIMERKPGVNAKTIASMINEIYTLNHPLHQLSSIPTIVHSITSYFPRSQTAERFTKLLTAVDQNGPSCMTRLNIFVSQHMSDVITMLDTIKQTSLELQQVITFHQIREMKEPEEYQPKCLIIDEVQDNSIFEFIFALEYVRKHEAAVYLVGDNSQTLYEFRFAHPQALSALKDSGVFRVFPLTTNYRSKAEILAFANAHLAQIEANNTTQLRLQTPQKTEFTAADFAHAVTVDYTRVQSRKAFDLVAKITSNEVRSYIDACVKRGEKVAFLSWYRSDGDDVCEALSQMYPDTEVAVLTSDRPFETTMFSKFVSKLWNDVLQADPQQVIDFIAALMRDNLSKIAPSSAASLQIATEQIEAWKTAHGSLIASWQRQVEIGSMTPEAFFDSVKHSLLSHEIKVNAYTSRITGQRNRERKDINAESNAPFIVSTIHGAKGLEFDNVVLLHQYKNHMNEENKRMYYVGLTRAINTEYVISFGSVVSAEIVECHETLMQTCSDYEKIRVLTEAGYDPENMSDAAIEATLDALGFKPAEVSVTTTVVDESSVPLLDGDKPAHNDVSQAFARFGIEVSSSSAPADAPSEAKPQTGGGMTSGNVESALARFGFRVK